jgi:Arc/MetJ-type ribon-helix-helix transcriptional regulator
MGKLWSVYVPNGLNNTAEEVLKSETFKSRSELVRTALRQLLKETKGEKTNV